MFLNKRSVSPLIATILIIVVSVILITVILTWGSSFAKDKLSIAQSPVLQNTDFTGLITNRSLSANDILISNNHSSRDLNITGYKLIASLDNDLYSYFENKIYYLEDPLVIGSRQAELLQIDCYPEESFFIDLLTDQNTYVRTQVLAGSINDIDPLRCRLILDFDSTNGYITDRTGKNTLTATDVSIKKTGSYYSAEFNGTTSTLITDSTDPTIWQDGFTVVAWIKPRSWGETNYGRILDVSTGAAGNDGFNFCINPLYNSLFCNINAVGAIRSESNSINLGSWNFAVLTVSSGSKINIYRGDLDIAPTLSGLEKISGLITSITTTNPLTIGNRSTATDGTFDGNIPMLKVYKGVLSLEQLTQIWSSTRGKVN